MMIETSRLIFKKIEETDLESVFKIYSDVELTKYFACGADKTLEQTGDRIKKAKAHFDKYGFGDFILLDKEDLKVIGYAGLHYKVQGGNVNISYIIDKNFWGKGLGYETCSGLITYGFENFKLDKIVAEIDPKNVNSIRLVEKCGFKFNRKMEWQGVERLEYVMLDF